MARRIARRAALVGLLAGALWLAAGLLLWSAIGGLE